MLKKEMKVINGDPLTFENKDCHVTIQWYDRIFNDQLEAYEDWHEENEHANEGKGWTEFFETITDTAMDLNIDVRWWEYRGKACRDDVPAPLVICFDEYYNQSWQYVADDNGLVIIAFEYHKNMTPPPGGMGALGFGPDKSEIQGYKKAVGAIMRRYNIDKTRVYLNGLSYGDMSALCYAKEYPNDLAGIVLMNGPTCPYNIGAYELMGNLPALPAMTLRSDSDMTCDGFPNKLSFDVGDNFEWLRYVRSKQTVYNRDLWMKQNKAEVLPTITSKGKRVYIKYDGDLPVIYNELNDRCHMRGIEYQTIDTSMTVPAEGKFWIQFGCADCYVSFVPGALSQHLEFSLEADPVSLLRDLEEKAKIQIWKSGMYCNEVKHFVSEAFKQLTKAKEYLWEAKHTVTKSQLADDETEAQLLVSQAASFFAKAQMQAKQVLVYIDRE